MDGQKINRKIFVARKPMAPHPGKVRSQASAMLRTTERFTEESPLAEPTPITAEVFTWVVETGKLMRVQRSRERL